MSANTQVAKPRGLGFGSTPDGRQALSVAATFALAVALFVAATIYSSGFAALSNVQALSVFATFTGLAALGQTFVILTGGMDMSVPWLIGFGGIQLSQLTGNSGIPVGTAVLVVVVIGLLIGCVTGLLVTVLDAPSMIVTLGMGGLVQGYLVAVGTINSNGAVVPDEMKELAVAKFGPVPVVTIIFLVAALLVWLVLTRTVLGRSIYLGGSNPKAARLAGIRVARVRFATYVFSAGLATLSGVLLSGFIQTAYLDMGGQYLFASVAALALGGTALIGGIGSAWGTVAGALVLTVLAGALPMFGLGAAWEKVVDGAVILAGVYMARNIRRLGERNAKASPGGGPASAAPPDGAEDPKLAGAIPDAG